MRKVSPRCNHTVCVVVHIWPFDASLCNESTIFENFFLALDERAGMKNVTIWPHSQVWWENDDYNDYVDGKMANHFSFLCSFAV